MKKIITIMMALTLGAIANADLVDGGFTGLTQDGRGGGLDNANDVNGIWYESSTSIDGSNNTARINAAAWSDANPQWIGQMWNDTSLTGNNFFQFDVVNEGYTAGSGRQEVRVEIYSVLTSPVRSWSAMSLGSVATPGTGFSLIGSETIDISGGLGTYQTANFDFTTTDTIYTVRFRATGDNPGLDNFLEIDNASVVPEPATVGMLGLGALVSLLIRRIRK